MATDTNVTVNTVVTKFNYTAIETEDLGGAGLDFELFTTAGQTTTASQIAEDRLPLVHILAYILVPIGCLLVIGLLALIVYCIVRRIRLKKFNRHMMPTYNYEAQTDEPDWETDLLDQDREQQMALRSQPDNDGDDSPKLRFNPDHLDLY